MLLFHVVLLLREQPALRPTANLLLGDVVDARAPGVVPEDAVIVRTTNKRAPGPLRSQHYKQVVPNMLDPLEVHANTTTVALHRAGKLPTTLFL